MKPERWRQIERILHAALERAPAERAALLDLECAGDPALRKDVESLIASAQPAQGFLKANALEDAVFLETVKPASLVGCQVGHYLIEKQIGSGGMGEVYLAKDIRLSRDVGLKLLYPDLTGNRATRMRFLREARLASALDHPNICTIHEVGEAAGHLFIAMQYVEGATLRRAISGRPMDLDSLLSVTLQIADALSAAHSRGIIHRDIKPGNIIITPRGQVKVLDFGLAKLLDRSEGEAETHLTMTGAVMGTPSAMSPEQARGERVDHRSDIFSFGVVLYEMATGRTPFSGRSKADVISALLNEQHTPPSELNSEITPQLSGVIDHALAKGVNERYQTMDELIIDLRQVVKEVGGLDRLFSSSNIALRAVPLVPLRQRGLLGRLRSPAAILLLPLIVMLLVGVALVIYSLRLDHQPAANPAIRSLAVLPFKPLVAGSRDEALELGMADTLIHKLSSIKQLSVRPLNAVRKYAELEQDARAAGRELKVDAVLDGNLQKSNDRIRVTLRLVSVADGHEIWTDQFDEKLTDIFSVQDSVARKITGMLSITLSGEEKELLTKRQTGDPEAYRLYLMGRYHLNRLTDDGFKKAGDYFQQAIDKDLGYALAYAGLADSYNLLSGFNSLSPKEGYPKARIAAMKALELDSNLAEAHTSLGTVKFFYDWDWSGADEEFRRAIEINPSYSDAHQVYSYYLSAMGSFDDALTEIHRAQELDPLPLSNLIIAGDILRFQHHYDLALEQYQKALGMDPNSGLAHWAIGNAYINMRRYKEAVEEYEKAIPLSGESPDEVASLGYAYALLGKRREAMRIIRDLSERSNRSYVSPSLTASIYIGIGETDQSFEWLDKAYNGRDFFLVFLRVDPMFDTLRSDPRFADLVHRVGLPD